MKKNIYRLFTLIIAVGIALGANAKDLSGVKIYINPGHGGYNMTAEKNDRNIPTIPFEPLDQNGFWESSCNLVKGLELQHLLTQSGATVVMSRTQNRDEDDKDLSEIAEEANASECDVFISVHSNALGSNNGTNYLLCLYKGVEGGATGDAAKPIDKELAREAWPYLFDNNLTVWTGNFSPENPCIKDDYHFLGYYLGVMRPLTVPGFLVEGSFHDYEPETHRLLNDDYAKLTAVCLHRFFCDRFDADKTGKGVIAGSVKDSQRVMTHQYFNNFVKNSHDQYQPINGATISLMNASGNTIATYTTDQYYNGIYVFRDLAPGNYKVKMEAEGYTSQTKEVTVTADKTTSFYTLLEDPNYIPPAKIPGKANIYASALSARKTDDGKYDLSFTLNADADQVNIKISKDGQELKDIDCGSLPKGENTIQADITDTNQEDLDWSVVAQAQPTTAEAPLKFTDNDEAPMQFKEARGIAVDNNSESPYFGRIYISESAGGSITGYRTTTDGIFILDAALTDITEQGNNGYQGGINWTASSSPMRVAVAPDGSIFITDWSDSHSGIWIMDPANPNGAFSPVFAESSRASSGLVSINGTAVHGSISSCWITGTGNDRKLYTFDEDYVDATSGNAFVLLQYNIGKLETPWDQAPSNVVFNNQNKLQQNGNSVILPDDRGGWWISQYRFTDNSTIPSLIHVNTAGETDFNSGSTGLIGTSQRGAMAINCTGNLLAMGCADEIKIFEITYGSGAPSLTLKHTIAPALGDYSSSLAFDIADNIYLATGTNGGIGAWALPKENNSFETKAPAVMRLNATQTGIENTVYTKAMAYVNENTLFVESDQEIGSIAIYNLSGIKLIERNPVNSTQATIDIGHLSNGIYFAKIDNRIIKFIK